MSGRQADGRAQQSTECSGLRQHKSNVNVVIPCNAKFNCVTSCEGRCRLIEVVGWVQGTTGVA